MSESESETKAMTGAEVERGPDLDRRRDAEHRVRDFDVGEIILAIVIAIGLCVAFLASGCAIDCEPHVEVVAPDATPAPDSAPACREGYYNDAGILVEPRCDNGFNCDDGICSPCGALAEPCCRAGTFLYCEGFSCSAGVCQ